MRSLALVLTAVLLVAHSATADGQTSYWVDSPPPEGARDGPLREAWNVALALERERRLEESALRYEEIARQLPHVAEPRWRVARNWWRLGESLPVLDKERRMALFARADEAARTCLEIDPDCAECMLWRVASMGRLATTQGVMSSARQAPEMARLIERAIELAPTHRDNAINSTLGNLYYSGAVFYRLVPDWFWLEWVLGVKGDKARSVEYSRLAVAESDQRIDYMVELGAGLICLGTDRDDPETTAEGRRTLQVASSLDRSLDTDSFDIEHARVLLDEPEKACGFSRDGWIEVDAESFGAGDGVGTEGPDGERSSP